MLIYQNDIMGSWFFINIIAWGHVYHQYHIMGSFLLSISYHSVMFIYQYNIIVSCLFQTALSASFCDKKCFFGAFDKTSARASIC